MYNASEWPIVLAEFQNMIGDIESDFLQYIPGIIAQYSPFIDILTNLNEIFYIPEDSQEDFFSLLRTYAQKNGLAKEIESFIKHTLTDNARFHRPLTPSQKEILIKREDIEYKRLKKLGREESFWIKIILEAHHKNLLPLDFDTFVETYSMLGKFNTEHVVLRCG